MSPSGLGLGPADLTTHVCIDMVHGTAGMTEGDR
jgi:hypothetical protein